MRGLHSSRRALGVHDDLAQTGAVAQVDENEAAVVPPGVRPAGETQSAADVVRAHLAAQKVPPAAADRLGFALGPAHPRYLAAISWTPIASSGDSRVRFSTAPSAFTST